MLLPVAIIFVALLSGFGMAYGTHPDLAQFHYGLNWIMLGRRLEWPLATVSLASCVVLLAVVVGGRRRAWWLLALGPVLALFAHKFSPSANVRGILEAPQFLEADAPAAELPASNEFVVGVVFDGQAYALPFRALYTTPVVDIPDHDKHLLLIWSAAANRATANTVFRELRPRDLEIVSDPANALLLYDRRLGQFICGVTGRTVDNKKPVGFLSPLSTEKCEWSNWFARHPDTRVLSSTGASANAPGRPIYPTRPMPADDAKGPPPHAFVTVFATTQPAAIESDAAVNAPLNFTAGTTPLLILRDNATGQLHAFDRTMGGDLFPRFAYKPDRKHPEATLVDTDSRSAWTTAGVCVDGPLKGSKLRPIESDAMLYWPVMKFWYPDLVLLDVSDAAKVEEQPDDPRAGDAEARESDREPIRRSRRRKPPGTFRETTTFARCPPARAGGYERVTLSA